MGWIFSLLFFFHTAIIEKTAIIDQFYPGPCLISYHIVTISQDVILFSYKYAQNQEPYELLEIEHSVCECVPLTYASMCLQIYFRATVFFGEH